MSTLVLDSDLQPVNLNDYTRDEENGLSKNMAQRFLSAGASRYDRENEYVKEQVFFHNIPENAAFYHKNYLEYIQKAYGRHYNIVLSPEVFWYSMMCEVALAVTDNPEAYRSIFTRSADKIDIVVEGSETEPLKIDAILDKMLPHLPNDPALFLPKFSTSTKMSNAATLAAFLETTSPYYNYMMLACGIPKVKILGDRHDWQGMVTHIVELQRLFASADSGKIMNYLNKPLAIAKRIMGIKTFGVISEDIKFFRGIFTQKPCGSGSQFMVNGWWASCMYATFPKAMPEVCNFPAHITKVPYTTLPSGTEWKLCFGLTHSYEDAEEFFHPQFSMVQIRIHNPECKVPRSPLKVWRPGEVEVRDIITLEQSKQ